MIENIRKLLVFGFFKAIVFFAVFLFSILGFSEAYVELEEAIAKASIILPWLVFGTTTSYSHYVINSRIRGLKYLYWKHHLVCIVFLFVLYIVLSMKKEGTVLIMMLISFLFARVASQIYKTRNMVGVASLLDSLPYMLLLIILGLMQFGVSLEGGDTVVTFVFGPIAVALLVYNTISVRPETRRELETLKFYSFGFKAFIVSAVITFFALTPRAFAPELIASDDLELYYLTIRYSLLAVLVYQFVSIRWFTHIYSLDIKGIGYASVILLLSASAVTYVSVHALALAGAIQDPRYSVFGACYTGLWVLSSFFEYFINRERRALFFLASTLLLIVAFGLWMVSVIPKEGELFFCSLLGGVVLLQAYSIFRDDLKYFWLLLSPISFLIYLQV